MPQQFDHQNKATYLNGRTGLTSATAAAPPAIVSPSLMVADQAALLQDALHVLSPAGGAVEWLHVDVIDGHFAPNLSFCPDTVRALRRHLPHAFLDCHLMVTDPAAWVGVFAAAGASSFSFHYEVTGPEGDGKAGTHSAAEVCRLARAAGMQVGVALKPQTPASVLFPLLDAGELDFVLVMTVNPGFAGQSFMPGPLEKVRALRRRYPALSIQVDGAVNLGTIDQIAAAGANVLVPAQPLHGRRPQGGRGEAARSGAQEQRQDRLPPVRGREGGNERGEH